MSYGAASRRCTLCARSISISNWRRHVAGAEHRENLHKRERGAKRFTVTYQRIVTRVECEFECEFECDSSQTALNIVRVSNGWANAWPIKGPQPAETRIVVLDAKEVP